MQEPMQHLRLVLIIIGAVAIAGLLLHGLWLSRKNRPKTFKDKPMPKVDGSDDSAFDADGIGKVRVVGRPELKTHEEPVIDFSANEEKSQNQAPDPVVKVTAPTQDNHVEPSLNADALQKVEAAVVTQEPVIEPQVERTPLYTSIEEPVVEAAPVYAAPEEPVKQEPVAEPTKDKAGLSEEPQDVFVLNVVAREGEVLAGAELLPLLLTLGFKFGEMEIFHRHLEPSGTGPVLFSMANMVKPGTFDIDNMEQFESHGLSFFMAVPCAGEPGANFNLMLHAAEMLASELKGVLLDGHRNPLTKQTVQYYKERIREFERRQLLVN